MKAVELFAGIGGFRLACDALGIETVFANDLKPTACAVYADQFGEAVLHVGDINELMPLIPEHDLLTAGFPCQPFSIAVKKEGVRDSRGTLFQSIVQVLENKRPRLFVLENVKRLLSMESGEHFATILDALSSLGYSLEWRLINAMHLGLPQNRQRLFISGVLEDKPQVRLLCNEEITHLPPGHRASLSRPESWQKITVHGKAFPFWGAARDGRFLAYNVDFFSDAQPLVRLKEVLQSDVGQEFDFTETTLSWIEKNTIVDKYVQGVEIVSNQRGGARMGYTIFGTNGVAPTLTASTSRHYERYKIGEKYRRLTNVEYARIQGFPDNHCRVASVYNQYELYGNAVPPALVSWVLGRLLAAPTAQAPINNKQMEMFAYGN